MNIKAQDLIIKKTATISAALKLMDHVGHKLLIIVDENDLFAGLVTIGDIQRAIIANESLDKSVLQITRKDLIVAYTEDKPQDIKREMLKYRLEYMPILNRKNEIVDVVFWENIINEDINITFPSLGCPVVIMAGGFGTRLRPLTNILPKPLLPYGEKTILENIVERFERYGCKDFYISVNYKADLIQYYFDNIATKSAGKLTLFTEDKPLGTAGSLRLLTNQLRSTFFVSNCDILIDQDYSAVYDYHKEQENELTMVASLKQYNIPYGTIESGANGELISLQEKPELTFMVNCGMYILEPHLLKEIPNDTFFHITDLIDRIKQRGGKVGVFPISEKSWTDIGEWPLYSKVLFQH